MTDTQHLRDYTELRRSVTDRKVAGVAGGLGRHLDVDPTVLRVVLVVLCFFGGAGLLLYAALWLLVPEEGREEGVVPVSPGSRNAVLLVVAGIAGLLLLGDSLGGFGFPWPLAVVALVVAVLLMNRDRAAAGTTTGTTTGTATPDAPSPTYPPTYAPTNPAYPPAYSAAHSAAPPAPPPPSIAERGPRLFWVAVPTLAVALGSLWLYDSLGGAVVAAAYPALALAVVGATLLLAAWWGRGGGLTLLGVLATLALAAATLVPPSLDDDRHLVAAPTTAGEVRDAYSVPAGRVQLDLTGVVDPEELDGRNLTLRATAGELVVLLPPGLDAAVTADIAMAGEVVVAGHGTAGTNVSVTREIDGGTDVPSVALDLDLAVGSIEVRQP